MAELKNEFSWSFSAAADFEECQRKRYWNKYGKWGGWARNASPTQKKAYQLDKMDSLYTILGQAVENAAMHILRQHQIGKVCEVEEAYDRIAKPFMNKAWKDSKEGLWRESPKKYTCLHEHYYRTLGDQEERELIAQLIEQAKRCLRNFSERTLPRISAVGRNMELPIQLPGMGGDAEHFLYEGVKIYAIPDYAYRREDAIHIHDWKAGRRKDSHRDQLAVYGLWAATKHRRNAEEDICVYVEYLNEGEIAADVIGREDMDRIGNKIDVSVADMTEMLVDADRHRNAPLPKEEWELALDASSCRRCNFFELCRKELQELGIV